MTTLTELEQQIEAKYNALKYRALPDTFSRRTVAHILGDMIYRELDGLDYMATNFKFEEKRITEAQVRTFYPLVGDSIKLAKDTIEMHGLSVGSIPKNYYNQSSREEVLDRTIFVFEELGLQPNLITTNNNGTLDLYVLDYDSRLLAQVMDGYQSPRSRSLQIPLDVRYSAEQLEREKKFSKQELQQYLLQEGRQVEIVGPLFSYDKDSQEITEKAMLLYGLLGAKQKVSADVELEAKKTTADRTQLHIIEGYANRIDCRLQELRASIKNKELIRI